MEFCSSVLEINLASVRHNCSVYINTAGVPIMAVVKADAYGCGAVAIAKAAEAAGIEAFAVARVGEAKILREAGIREPILVFNAFTQDEIDFGVAADLILTLNSFEMIDKLVNAADRQKKKALVHLKVDTGMGRFGVFPAEAGPLASAALATSRIEIDGIYSHFANIDEDPDSPLNAVQVARFEEALALLRQTGVTPRWIHCSNSASVLNLPASRFNLVRVGNALIGVNPFYYAEFPETLQRCLTWKTKLVSVRRLPAGYGIGYGQTYHLENDAWVGVIPVGYGDGYRRVAGNEVLIGGRRVPVIGSVCTDVCMVLLPERFNPGESVVLLGNQGRESITVEELAARWRTARADVMSGISARVARVYLP